VHCLRKKVTIHRMQFHGVGTTTHEVPCYSIAQLHHVLVLASKSCVLGLVRANQEPTCTQELLMINENGLQATFRFFGRRDNKYKFKEVDGVYRLHWVPRQGDPPQPAQLSA